MSRFLPVTIEDMRERGWDRPDFVFVIGDAYVDQSTFGPAIISRVLESHGYRVAIISQPDWKDDRSITTFGEPRLGFLVSAGNMDSMVNHYTVNKKKRHEDAYTPGGEAGKRPDYATVVYCNLIKRTYKKSPVMIGGIEASLRRMGHYDYWSDRMKRSVLMDSGADLLMYGMGELSVVAIADALAGGIAVEDITFIPGTVYKAKEVTDVVEKSGGIILPDFERLQQDKTKYAESFAIQYKNTDFATAKPLIEKYGEKRYIVQNPPSRPLTTEELDAVYELPYMNDYHPSYRAAGGVAALGDMPFSLTSNRGCFGGCSFCALTFHQGRIVQTRSRESLVQEARRMTQNPGFKGNIFDVGGPTANFFRPACDKQLEHGVCANKQCLYPQPCKNMKVDHTGYIKLLRELRAVPGVKKVFIRSGIRYDYVLADKDDSFLRELCKYHISGQLRVAPEHVTDHVLDLMGKPRAQVYERFVNEFKRVNASLKMNQYIVPYLISSHPGSTLEDAIALAESVRDMGYMPEQVQDFYPTPSTISTVMYYTGLDPRTMKPVDVTRSPHEKAMQRALIQYRKPENYELVKEALIKCGRQDLIGFDKNKCLIPPRKLAGEMHRDGADKRSSGDGRRSADRGNGRGIGGGKAGSNYTAAGRTGGRDTGKAGNHGSKGGRSAAKTNAGGGGFNKNNSAGRVRQGRK